MPQPVHVKDLISRLQVKPDSQAVVGTYQGRALSRSEDSLHLAVSGGVIAIPLAQIDRVSPASSVLPDLVRVVVKNPSTIRPLLKVRPSGRPGQTPSGVSGGAVAMERIPIGTGMVGVGTCTYYTTTTTCGDEGEDACDDDGGSECEPDDLE